MQYHDAIQQLNKELGVYKRAYNDIEHERESLQRQVADTERRNGELESQLKVLSFVSSP